MFYFSVCRIFDDSVQKTVGQFWYLLAPFHDETDEQLERPALRIHSVVTYVLYVMIHNNSVCI